MESADGLDTSGKAKSILAAAAQRDEAADIRDVRSEERAAAADLKAFLDTGQLYVGHGERRAAALDRAHSKRDRESSADDRARLVEGEESG
ncbi:MAG: hypothetical protein ACKVOG_07290 [Rhodoglobus sp.]